MAVANKLFLEVAECYAKAVVLSDSIYTQISSLKRWNSNAEMDRLHVLYHNEHHAPATGEEQKLALFLLCPGFSECSNPCAVGKVCEVYTYVNWKEGDEHAKRCAWALHNLQLAFHNYFACGAVQNGAQTWNKKMEVWEDVLEYHVPGHVQQFFFWNFSCFVREARPCHFSWLRGSPAIWFATLRTEALVQDTLQLPPLQLPAIPVATPVTNPVSTAADLQTTMRAPPADSRAEEVAPSRWNRRREEHHGGWGWADQHVEWVNYRGSWFFYCSCMGCWVKQKMETRAYCSWSNGSGWRNNDDWRSGWDYAWQWCFAPCETHGAGICLQWHTFPTARQNQPRIYPAVLLRMLPAFLGDSAQAGLAALDKMMAGKHVAAFVFHISTWNICFFNYSRQSWQLSFWISFLLGTPIFLGTKLQVKFLKFLFTGAFKFFWSTVSS